jgi:hypothetical protein
MRRKLRVFASSRWKLSNGLFQKKALSTARFSPVGLVLLLLSMPGNFALGGESWHVTPGAGVLLFSGGQPTRDGLAGTLRFGYDLDAPISIELGGLAGNFDCRDNAADSGGGNIYGAWADAIIHLARWERFDPFLGVGAGAFWSDRHALPDNRQEGGVPRLGAGVLYTLSEHWSLRAGVTAMTMRMTDRHACFGIVEAGLSYYFGDTTPAYPGETRTAN